MYKITFILCLIISIKTISQTKFDTLAVKQVGKEIFHLAIEEKSVPWTLDVLKIKLNTDQIKIETVKANDRKSSWERTSSMTARKSNDGHYVVGAVNGDFYDGNGTPVGMQILDGEIITPSNNWTALGFDANNMPLIDRTNLSGKVIAGSSTKNIDSYNNTRNTDYLVLYNSYFGSSTSTNQWGCEVTIEPLTSWVVNDSVRCIVTDKVSDQGNSTLSPGRAVLSGHGTSKTFLEDNVNIGDTITILNTVEPGLPNLTQLINGFPKIIRDGENCALDCYAEEGGSTNFATARHPRTAAGISEDGSYLFLVTVDGRQESSAGMSLPELADFMIELGVYRAVNLDGGGSTTMVVRSDIVNSPSDPGGERSVSNALMVVSEATAGPLSQVSLNSIFAKVDRHENYQFTTTGYDEHMNSLHQLNQSGIAYSLSHDFGTINSSGLFTAGSTYDTGYVYTDYSGYRDSAMVIVNSLRQIEVSPASAVTDTSSTIKFNVRTADLDGIDWNLDNEEFSWLSTDTSVGTVDSSGTFTGLTPGTADIIVTWENLSDTSTVTVVVEEGVQVINSFDNINNWYLTGEGIDTTVSTITISQDAASEGSTSLKLEYQFTYTSGLISWAYLNCDIIVSGVPANLGVDAKTDAEEHSVALVVENNAGDQYALLGNKKTDSIDDFTPIWFDFENPVPLTGNSQFHFPVIIKQVAVILGSDREVGVIYNGTMYLDNLRAVYPDAVAHADDEAIIPTELVLFQNYPNPFNPETTIQYSIPNIKTGYSPSLQTVVLKVYDVLGREVAILVNENQKPGNYSVTFSGKGLSSGIYLYRLTSGNTSIVKKLTLLK